jgi:hypothetical protein
MKHIFSFRQLPLALALCVGFGNAGAADLDPKAISIKLPEQINWVLCEIQWVIEFQLST